MTPLHPSIARRRWLRAAAGTLAWVSGAAGSAAWATAATSAASAVSDAPPCAAAASASGGLPPGSVVKVLWVGNSLTNTALDLRRFDLGPMPARLAPMLAELGVTLKWAAILRGGAEFGDHARNPAIEARLAQEHFDAVNLQGYYQGYASADAMVAAVRPLVETARRHRSVALLQQVWSFQGDPGSPQYPGAALAVEQAAERLPGALPVQILRVWNDVRGEPGLYPRLFADATHQSVLGEYLNALAFARFFSGRSVRAIQSAHPAVLAGASETERRRLKEAVDRQITRFYRGFEALSAPSRAGRCADGG
jgi:hypothetical protein